MYPRFLQFWAASYGFPVMVLPLCVSMALSLSSSLDNAQREVLQRCRFFFEFYLRVLERVSNTYRIRSRLSLVSLSSHSSILPISFSLRFDSSLTTLDPPSCFKSLIRLAAYQSKFASRSSARLCRCRLVILQELEDRLETSFLLSKHCLDFGASDCVLLSSFPRLFLEQCCEHLLDSLLPAVSRGSFDSKHPAVVAAHSRHF